MASLSQKAGVLIAANFVKYAVGFIMPMLLVRMLTKEDYGTLQQITLVGTMVVGMLTLGLPNSVYFFYRRENAAMSRALVQQSVWILFAAGVLGALGLAVFAPAIANFTHNPAIAIFLPIFALGVGLNIAGDHFVHFMIAQDRYAMAVLFEMGEAMLRVAMLVIPLLAGYGLTGLVWATVAVALARFLLRESFLLKGIGWKLLPKKGSTFIPDQLAYSLPMFMTMVAGLIGEQIDRMLVASNFTAAQYAIYTIGALSIPLDTIFQSAVANVLRASLPALVREKNFEEIARLMREAVRKLSIIVLPSFVFLFGFAHEFITLLFTRNYADSVVVFRIYLWMIPLHMMMLSPIPQAFGKTRINMQLVMFTTVLHIVLSFFALKWIGYLGPAISSIATSWLLSLLYLVMAGKLLQMPISRLLPKGALLRVITAACLALLAAKLAFGNTNITLIGFVLIGALYSAGFFVAAILLGVFTAQDRATAGRLAAKLGLAKR